MRKFLNLPKIKNKTLAKQYSYLLKYTDDRSSEECQWLAISVFDHWLYKTNSFSIVENATDKQKLTWTNQIYQFLLDIVELERPIYFKYAGKHTKSSIQFRDYVGETPIGQFLCKQYDDIYEPNVIFESIALHLMFEDNWTIILDYQDLEKLEPVLNLMNQHNLYALPVERVENLNMYSEVEAMLTKMNLDNLKCRSL
ncbi:hypothetical protein [Thalassomonas sp. M1454]|uniref:hypothetical protein n=1 Tax=Thalassomonas sp. M1454 TaxID=2594477 RepID=UPI001180411E|nr:hypothetical protein [Thalassomonas sp. M1454]TRX57301.1 hypothetical protein FNN08_07340 [Thalassomonas sp. M1454]